MQDLNLRYERFTRIIVTHYRNAAPHENYQQQYQADSYNVNRTLKSLLLFLWQCHMEGRPLPQNAVHPDFSSMPFHNAFGNE